MDPVFKAPPKSAFAASLGTPTSPDESRTSQPSVQLPQFKKPKPPSPAGTTATGSGEGVKGAAPRTSRAAKKTQRKAFSANSNALNAKALGDLAAESSHRLGVPELHSKVPISSGISCSPAGQSSSSSRLSSPPTSIENLPPSAPALSQAEIEEFFPDSELAPCVSADSSSEPVCPLCKSPVGRLFLEGYIGTRRLTIREQAAFCKSHRLHSAQEEWDAKGYPSIAWERFNDRLNNHHPLIEELIRGKRASYYRNVFEDLLKKEQNGKRKTLQQTLMEGGGIEDFAPGYYGSRGARMMYVSPHLSISLVMQRSLCYDD